MGSALNASLKSSAAAWTRSVMGGRFCFGYGS